MLLTRLTLLVFLGILPAYGLAVLHPHAENPRITRCVNGSEGACSEDVYYAIDSFVLRETAPLSPPSSNMDTALQAMSIHCKYGNASKGLPFRDCSWVSYKHSHAPALGNCTLKSTLSWELTPSSTCHATVTTWGNHAGAAPGGECVVVVQSQNPSNHAGPIATIFGIVTPDTLANSGNYYCQKPLAPTPTCSIELPALIDHRVMAADEISVVSIDGTISCGSHPVVTIVGGGRIPMGPGVVTELVPSVTSPEHVKLTSTLVTNNAGPGDHSASAIVVVSPY